MSLACLSCQAVQRTHSDLTSCSPSPEEGQRCGGVTWCWYKKNQRQQPRAEETNAAMVSTRVAPAPSSRSTSTNINEGHGSPRLTRCHAVRRDIIRDWNVEDFAEASFA